MSTPQRSLEDVLQEASRLGWLGIDDCQAVIDHSLKFVRALHDVSGTVLDMGTGPGVPGLIIAQSRPDIRLVLLDRRAARIDFLMRAVTALGLGDRVRPLLGEAPGVASLAGLAGTVNAVVARAFGSPAETLRCARPFLVPGGALVVSEPPDRPGARWVPEDVAAQGFSGPDVLDGLVVFHVEQSRTADSA